MFMLYLLYIHMYVDGFLHTSIPIQQSSSNLDNMYTAAMILQSGNAHINNIIQHKYEHPATDKIPCWRISFIHKREIKSIFED